MTVGSLNSFVASSAFSSDRASAAATSVFALHSSERARELFNEPEPPVPGTRKSAAPSFAVRGELRKERRGRAQLDRRSKSHWAIATPQGSAGEDASDHASARDRD